MNELRFVLCSDPMQMGPKVYSPEAKALNLGVSLLKRLFDEYQKQAAAARSLDSLDWLRQETTNPWGLVNNPFTSTLTANYRSRPEIVQFLSLVFYSGRDRLRAVAQLPEVLSGPCQPALCFYVALGQEELDETSLSWYNQAEMDELVDRVRMVLEFWPTEWGPRDPAQVCVISHYQSQVRRIRARFRRETSKPSQAGVRATPAEAVDMGAVTVDTINNIQGADPFSAP